MALEVSKVVSAFVNQYLIKCNVEVAGLFQKKCKPATFDKGSPLLEEAILHYVNTNNHAKKIKLVGKSDSTQYFANSTFDTNTQTQVVKPTVVKSTPVYSCSSEDEADLSSDYLFEGESWEAFSSEDEKPAKKPVVKPMQKKVKSSSDEPDSDEVLSEKKVSVTSISVKVEPKNAESNSDDFSVVSNQRRLPFVLHKFCCNGQKPAPKMVEILEESSSEDKALKKNGLVKPEPVTVAPKFALMRNHLHSSSEDSDSEEEVESSSDYFADDEEISKPALVRNHLYGLLSAVKSAPKKADNLEVKVALKKAVTSSEDSDNEEEAESSLDDFSDDKEITKFALVQKLSAIKKVCRAKQYLLKSFLRNLHKTAKSSFDSSSEEEEDNSLDDSTDAEPASAKKLVAVKSAPKKTESSEESFSEDEAPKEKLFLLNLQETESSSDEFDSDKEPPANKAKVLVQPVIKAIGSSSDEQPATPVKKSLVPAKKLSNAESSLEDSTEDELPMATSTPVPKNVAKKESSSEIDSDKEEKPAKGIKRKAVNSEYAPVAKKINYSKFEPKNFKWQ